jgi:molecular chaperone DnaK
MGLSFEESKEAQKHVLYKVVNHNGNAWVEINGEEYSPEQLSAMIIQKLKKSAEDYIGETVTDAVISVPAFFNVTQKNATKQAGEIAGLNVLRIIPEPTAALRASNIDMKKGGKYMVVDYGGATTDISIADVADDVIEILSNYGDVYLGGSDIDNIVAKYIVDTFKEDSGIDMSGDAMAMARITEAAEQAKITLSQSSVADINLPYITIKDGTPLHITQTLSKAKFEQMISEQIEKVVNCGKEALNMADLKASDLDAILLVGGSCRIPLLQKRLEEEFKAPLNKSLDLDMAVAQGAAILADAIANSESTSNEVLLLDVTPLSLGIETLGGVMTTLIEASTTIPCKKVETFSTAVDNQSQVDIHVLQGNRPMANQNKSIGLFKLDGIMPAKRGIPQIEVTFDIDANGILSVTAKDKATGKEQNIKIDNRGGLTDSEVEEMKKAAIENEEADKKLKKDAETINRGDSVIFSNEEMLKSYDEKLSSDEKANIQSLIDEMKTAVKEKNVSKIEEVEKSLTDAWNKISEKLYSNTQTTQETETSSKTDDKSSNDDIEDADFEEVK